MVQAGAFDSLHDNRQALFNSITTIILKSKNIYESKSANQIDLFKDQEKNEDSFIESIEDWPKDIKLTKEFSTLGFYISDHPLSQYKSIFKQYNITNYADFEINNDFLSSNIACTVLKVQEKKTQKGSSYSIVKFSDLSSVFELFIFSDIYEINRDKLVEGNSLMLTLIKNYSNDEKTKIRINVKNIISLKDVINKPLRNITLSFKKFNDIYKLKNLNKTNGETDVKIILHENNQVITFMLKDKRFVNNKLLNSLNLMENLVNE